MFFLTFLFEQETVRLFFATCFDPNIFADLRAKERKLLRLKPTSADVVYSEVKEDELSGSTMFIESSLSPSLALQNIPTSVALLFGTFEAVLSNKINQGSVDGSAASVKDLFPRISNGGLMAPVDDGGISMEKLRQRLLEEGLSEAAIQEMVHSISSREVIVRSSRGLTELGTLFKNLMAILLDVVICHDVTVRNICSNSILQFEYGVHNLNVQSEFCTGEPVGVLAATAMCTPAYKAVLDSSLSSNYSWEMMKEILLCGANFKNEISDRRIVLYLKNVIVE